MTRNTAHLWLAGVAVCVSLTAASCGGSAAVPSRPVAVDGVWSGIIGEASGGGRALRVTWVATQNGAEVSGPATVSTSPAITDTSFSGTLGGTISGDQIVLSLSATPQAKSGCALTGTGSGTASGNTISGDLDVVFTECGSLEPPNTHFTLTKQ